MSCRRLQTAPLVWVLALSVRGAAETVPAWTADGFALPQAGRRFEFPRDHGSHPGFKIEWWYVTGHLHDTTSNRFGFQATFFRRAADRLPGIAPAGSASFSHEHLHLAHMAWLDVASGRFVSEERLNREGWDATAATNTLRVRNGNWSLELVPGATNSAMRLRGGVDAMLDLNLVPQKPLVVFGTNGVSRKGSDPAAASHYFTWSRLAVDGRFRRGDTTQSVTGVAWMDHEISSSQLAPDQAGWDWACLQLDDGREIMAYRMRRKDGSTDPFSTMAWVAADGSVRHFAAHEFRWEPRGEWRSPKTGARYPAAIALTAPDPQGGADREFRIEPLAAAQELDGSAGGIAYWEGACRVVDTGGREIGRAFLELTGYAGNLGGALSAGRARMLPSGGR
jgi:predicted secreted hydrolase